MKQQRVVLKPNDRVPSTGSELCDLIDDIKDRWESIGLRLGVRQGDLAEIRSSLLYPEAWHKTSEMLQRARREFGKRGQHLLMSDLSKALGSGENSTENMEGLSFNYGNFKSELRGLLTTHVLETFCDVLPNITGVLREKILDQLNTNALISFLENYGYMSERRGISNLADVCRCNTGLSIVVDLCERFCPTAQKFSSETKGDMKTSSSSSSTPMLDLPPPFLNKVCVACTRTWEDIAWHMGYRNRDDRLVFGQVKTHPPMFQVLEDHWAQNGKKMTVGQFIEVLRRSERPRNDIIAMLEGAP